MAQLNTKRTKHTPVLSLGDVHDCVFDNTGMYVNVQAGSISPHPAKDSHCEEILQKARNEVTVPAQLGNTKGQRDLG